MGLMLHLDYQAMACRPRRILNAGHCQWSRRYRDACWVNDARTLLPSFDAPPLDSIALEFSRPPLGWGGRCFEAGLCSFPDPPLGSRLVCTTSALGNNEKKVKAWEANVFFFSNTAFSRFAGHMAEQPRVATSTSSRPHTSMLMRTGHRTQWRNCHASTENQGK